MNADPTAATLLERLPAAEGMADPLFVLATPRAFSSVVSTMLGQHPQMFALPETHLFGDATLAAWWERSSGAGFQMAHGMLRAVAELVFGEQTERTVALAAAWLRHRENETTGMLFETLGRAVAPLVLVDKSPSYVYDVESMRRVLRYFPRARFLHLVRHPQGYCRSVLKYLDTLSRPAYRPRDGRVVDGPPPWISELAFFGKEPDGDADPQAGWVALNANVVTFLESVPPEQWSVVRGEDVLREPERRLAELCDWLGLRGDAEAIEPMTHPERSPFARFGPRGARLGNDILFLQKPALRRPAKELLSLDGLAPDVVSLARRLGYER